MWKGFGWKVLVAEGGLKSSTARGSDGYAFDLSANTNGDLIVSASSPYVQVRTENRCRCS
ncbi:hypothetical protein AWH04_04505 [Rhodococcus erythropolis]|nr:hypothetical protein AWH04_04505 [Rhodococcus erythropolis]